MFSHSIRARLYRGIAGLIALIAISSSLGLVLLHKLSTNESKLAKKAQPYLADLSGAAVAAKAAANDERGYLMTGDPKFLQEIAVKRDPKVYGPLTDAKGIYPAGSPQTTAVDAVYGGYKAWAVARDAELKQYKSDKSGAIELALGANRDLRKAYEASIDDAVATADAAVASSDSSFNSTSSTASWVLFGFFACAVLVGVAFAIRLSKSVSGRLSRLTEVADKIAVGDVADLEVGVTGDDELGKLGDSMQGVVAAFQEMFASQAKAA
jgi:methyl-accepting chemotaxis protein